MKIFEEKQLFKRWWIIMFVLAIIVIVIGTAFYASEDSTEETSVTISVISLVITIPIVFSVLLLRLDTRIDDKGISTYFRPFGFTRKSFSWDEISECYIRSYSPLQEFGGWGLRILGMRSKAYNVAGNQGIQVVTNEGKKFLIGTQQPEDAQNTIDVYFKKNQP